MVQRLIFESRSTIKTRDVENAAVEIQEFWYGQLDGVTSRVGANDETAFTHDAASTGELGESERSEYIRSFEQLRVVADLSSAVSSCT